MTTSVRIVCTGNTEGDEITIRAGWGKAAHVSDPAVLARGEVSRLYAASGGAGVLWLRIEGTHGDGRALGEVDVRTRWLGPGQDAG